MDARPDHNDGTVTALVFAGGLSLAAYHGGAFEAFAQRAQPLHWLTGSSAGAITAALIAGNPPPCRIAALREFWSLTHAEPTWSPLPHLEGWISAVTAHLIGDPNHFHPRLPALFGFRSLYDLGPMRRRLARLIDFERINGGELRLSIAATDVCSGDPVIFDSHREPIELDHLLASCGFLPEFAPVAIGARTLVDGGLSLNAPFDPILAESGGPLRLFVLDLYARDDQPPASLEAALERKNDLLFGNQTYLRLKDKIRIRALERSAAGAAAFQDEITLLSYRAGPNEPGPEKSFNFSRRALAQRWQTGFDDMMAALAPSAPAIDGLRVIRRFTAPPQAAALRPAAQLR